MIVGPHDPSVETSWDPLEVAIAGLEEVVEDVFNVDDIVGFAVENGTLKLDVDDVLIDDFEDQLELEIELELPQAPPTGWHPVPQ